MDQVVWFLEKEENRISEKATGWEPKGRRHWRKPQEDYVQVGVNKYNFTLKTVKISGGTESNKMNGCLGQFIV